MDPRFPDRPSFRAALVTAANEIEAAVTDGPGEAWTVHGGTPGASNPNVAAWKAVASLAGGAWGFSPRPVGFPWTRRRASEIAAVRTRQLESLLRTPRTVEIHEKHPFTAGAALADRAAAFSWVVATAALSMALVLVVLTFASLPILGNLVTELTGRAEVQARIGEDPLPKPLDLANLGTLGRLGAAFLLATPIAFFLGGLHAAVHAVGEKLPSVARFTPWCSLFLGASSLLAFLPRAGIGWAILAALLIPASAQFGTSLMWGRRRDAVLSEPRPKWKFGPAMVAAVVAVLVLITALVPMPTTNDTRVQETSRFRDRFLLGHAAGRALAHFYYDCTLYAAEPVKPAYKWGTGVYDRQVRTALVIGKVGADSDVLRTEDFSVEKVEDPEAAVPLIRKRQHDLYVVAHGVVRTYAILKEEGLLGRTIRQGLTEVPGMQRVVTVTVPATPDDWRRALNRTLSFGALEAMLLELTWLGWTSIYYAGALFVFLLAAGPVAAGLAWLTRHRPARTVKAIVVGIFGVAVLGLAVLFIARSSTLSRVASLRSLPAEDQAALGRLAAGLKDPDPDVRYEATYQSYMALKRPTFPKGGLTAELTAGAKDADIRVRLWSVGALGLTRDPQVRETIFQAMDDPELLVRYRAAEGLENLDGGRVPPTPETIVRLRKMIRERSWYEGMYALAALRKVSPPRP